MRAFNTTRLVEQVTARGSLATGDFEDQEILDIAYDCLISDLVPLIITLREDFFVRTNSQTVTANQANYPIPSRAAGMVLRDIKLLTGTDVKPLFRIAREDVITTVASEPTSFYIEENNVVLYPTPSSTTGTLKLSYFLRCPALVEVTACGEIETIDTGTNTITGSFPSTWTTAETFDFVSGSQGYENMDQDRTASSVSTSSITFGAALPTGLAVGDYICLAEESCFVQLPQEAHNLLVYMTVEACLESKGDRDGLAAAKARVEKSAGLLRAMFQERVEGRPQRFRTRLL
jgi:hypothetical protein